MKTQAMKHTLSLLVALFFCSQLAAMPVFSDQQGPEGPRWEKLGTRKVRYAVDRDEIAVTRIDGRFTAIKIKVKNAPIDMMKCTVHFGNGQAQELAL